jgi:hypothetical protein
LDAERKECANLQLKEWEELSSGGIVSVVNIVGIDPGEVPNRADLGTEGSPKEGELTAKVRRRGSRNPADRWIVEKLWGSQPVGAGRIKAHRGSGFGV